MICENCPNKALIGIDNHLFCVTCYDIYFNNMPPGEAPDWYGVDDNGNRTHVVKKIKTIDWGI